MSEFLSEFEKKVITETVEELRRLKSYFESDLDDTDLQELSNSLMKMFKIGYNYSQNTRKVKE